MCSKRSKKKRVDEERKNGKEIYIMYYGENIITSNKYISILTESTYDNDIKLLENIITESTGLDKIKTILINILKFIGKILTTIINKIKNILSAIKTKIKKIFSAIKGEKVYINEKDHFDCTLIDDFEKSLFYFDNLYKISLDKSWSDYKESKEKDIFKFIVRTYYEDKVSKYSKELPHGIISVSGYISSVDTYKNIMNDIFDFYSRGSMNNTYYPKQIVENNIISKIEDDFQKFSLNATHLYKISNSINDNEIERIKNLFDESIDKEMYDIEETKEQNLFYKEFLTIKSKLLSIDIDMATKIENFGIKQIEKLAEFVRTHCTNKVSDVILKDKNKKFGYIYTPEN